MIKKVFKIEHVGDVSQNLVPVTIKRDDSIAPDVIVNIGATGDMLIDDFLSLVGSVLYKVNETYDTYYRIHTCDELIDP